MPRDKFLFHEITEGVIGAAMRVHSALGSGFPEVVYQRALEIELVENHIRHQREFEMTIFYRCTPVGKRRVDFLIENKISVELKAISLLEPLHLAQALNYLEAYNLEVGLLINFGTRSLEFKRLTNKKYRPDLGPLHTQTPQ